MAKLYKAVGEDLWKKSDKMNGELFALTYGSLVSHLIKDCNGDMKEVNLRLDKLGYQMGTRMIDDFFAKSGLAKCTDSKDTIEMITKVGFKMYLGFAPSVSSWSNDHKICNIVIDKSANWLTDFVQLDMETQNELSYCQFYCGILRGALEAVRIPIECNIIKDFLIEGDTLEIQVKFTKRPMDDPSSSYDT